MDPEGRPLALITGNSAHGKGCGGQGAHQYHEEPGEHAQSCSQTEAGKKDGQGTQTAADGGGQGGGEMVGIFTVFAQWHDGENDCNATKEADDQQETPDEEMIRVKTHVIRSAGQRPQPQQKAQKAQAQHKQQGRFDFQQVFHGRSPHGK